MTLDNLRSLIVSGNFHHATYRHDFARGLHIYAKEGYTGKPGFRGFEYVGCFSEACETKETIEAAYKLVRASGVYEGSYK